MAMIYYRFKGITVLDDDYPFSNQYYSHRINDDIFLIGKPPFSNERVHIISEIIPNFCDLIKLNVVNGTYDFGTVALTSDQVSENQIMYLIFKGIDIECIKGSSLDI